MRSIFAAGLCLALLAGTAAAETPQTPTPEAPAASTNAPSAQQPSGPARGQQNSPGPEISQGVQPATPNGDRAGGQVFQLPDGSYVIAEPTGGNRAQPDGNPAAGSPDIADGTLPMHMHMHRGHRVSPMSEGASFHFHGPDMNVDVKCAGGEPTKVCVDAAAQLLDKVQGSSKQ